MKIVDKTQPSKVYFYELEVGDTFLYNGSFFIKTDGLEPNSFSFTEKEGKVFYGKTNVEPVDCEIIFTNRK